jgi:hypothetical protein
MNDQELAKQMYAYADAITAFAFVQGITFGFVIGENPALALNVRQYWFFAVPIIAAMNWLFFVSVYLCHRAEDRLLGIPATRSEGIGVVVPKVRRMRLRIISVIGVGEIALAFGQAFWPARLFWH